MTAYRDIDGSITDVDPVRLDIRRAREWRDAGRPGWSYWLKAALRNYRRQGGLLPEIDVTEENAIAASLGFHVDASRRTEFITTDPNWV